MKRLLSFLLLATAIPMMAQLSDLANQGDRSIKITSDVMEVDIENGKTIFTGNVYVDDKDVIIKCTKMILYRVSKESGKKESNKKESNKKDDSFGDAKLDRIECYGSDDIPVVIKRKPPKDQKNAKDEWGTCGKAVYYHTKDSGMITMYEEPVLYQDDSRITGETLNLYNGSKRFTGTAVKLNARISSEEEKDSKRANKDQPAKKSDDKKSDDKKSDDKKLTQKEKDAILGL